MNPLDRRQRQLQRDLEPHILPRHRRALEQVAKRLAEARPAPDPDFRAALQGRIQALVGGEREEAAQPWQLPAVAAVALGLALLVVGAALAL